MTGNKPSGPRDLDAADMSDDAPEYGINNPVALTNNHDPEWNVDVDIDWNWNTYFVWGPAVHAVCLRKTTRSFHADGSL